LKWRCSGEFSACLVQLSLTAFDVDPQTVAMTNQLGMLGWDIAGSGFIFKPKSTRGTGNVDGGSTKVVQTESLPQTGRRPGLEGQGSMRWTSLVARRTRSWASVILRITRQSTRSSKWICVPQQMRTISWIASGRLVSCLRAM